MVPPEVEARTVEVEARTVEVEARTVEAIAKIAASFSWPSSSETNSIEKPAVFRAGFFFQ